MTVILKCPQETKVPLFTVSVVFFFYLEVQMGGWL